MTAGAGDAVSDDEPPRPEPGGETGIPGVRGLDHTADVGIEVEARDLAELFLRAARGLMWLILDGPLPEPEEERTVSARRGDPASLLRAWLKELLWWHEAEGLGFAEADFRQLTEERLEATVRGGPDPARPAREIKGVTFHGLVAERRDGGWFARVIFDV